MRTPITPILLLLALAFGCGGSGASSSRTAEPGGQTEPDLAGDPGGDVAGQGGQIEPDFGSDAAGQGGQIEPDFRDEPGGELASCEPVASTAVAPDETTPAGEPREALALAAGEHALTLRYAEGGSTGLQLVVTALEGDAHLIDLEVPARDDDGPIAEIGCADRLEIPVRVTLTSDDGSLDEVFETSLLAFSPGAAEIQLEVAADALGGTLDAAPDDDGEYDTLRVIVALRFDAEGPSGSLDGVASGTAGDAGDPNAAAFARHFPIAEM